MAMQWAIWLGTVYISLLTPCCMLTGILLPICYINIYTEDFERTSDYLWCCELYHNVKWNESDNSWLLPRTGSPDMRTHQIRQLLQNFKISRPYFISDDDLDHSLKLHLFQVMPFEKPSAKCQPFRSSINSSIRFLSQPKTLKDMHAHHVPIWHSCITHLLCEFQFVNVVLICYLWKISIGFFESLLL